MDAPEDLPVPGGPRDQLDSALAGLLTETGAAAQPSRLRDLMRATQSVVEPIDLPAVLRRIVEAAVDLVDAEYGALGVLSPGRDSLEQFVYVGMDAQQAARIGHLPEGRGLLGELITHPHPVIVADIAGDPRSIGFPVDHPPMTNFLGAPVRVGGEVFGNLYLTNQRRGHFTAEDLALLEALGSTAGLVIANARLFAEARMRERWMAGATELSAALLSTPTATGLDLIGTRVLEIAEADRVAVLVAADPDGPLRVVAARGADEDDLRGAMLDPADTFAAAVLRDSQPHVASRSTCAAPDRLLLQADGVHGPALAFPLRTETRLWGIVSAARAPGAPSFTAAEAEAAVELGSRAVLSLELAQAREQQERSLLMDERQRIARDLHDHVIQQLFGTGLQIQAVAGALEPSSQSALLDESVRQLDDAMAQIRTVVFALSARHPDTLRHHIIDVVAEFSGAAQRPPTIRFTGPVDHTVGPHTLSDVVAATRELLSNAVHHADAGQISVELAATDGWLSVQVADDGHGFGTRRRWSGLANLRERARMHRGDLHIQSSGAGTIARWRIPVDGEAAHERES